MNSTTYLVSPTVTQGPHHILRDPNELDDKYLHYINAGRLSWTTHLQFRRRLGAGGQGVVFLTDRRGADNFTLPVAVKIFSPERFPDIRGYELAMERIARVGSRVAQIQQDNLIDVQNFVDRERIRVMVMEWIDGFDLRQLLDHRWLNLVKDRVSVRRFREMNEVIVTYGPQQPRIKPGVAMAIIRDCLAALAALHREDIVHGDIKPSNIMLKRSGSAKIIDIGSAFETMEPPSFRTCTPAYAAVEVLDGAECTPRSDLASLGYLLIELLAGKPPFAEASTYAEIIEAKRRLPHKLHEFLPPDVTGCDHLMSFCQSLIAPDPNRRFPSAEAADLHSEGAAAFHRQLILGDLASEYSNELRLWIEELKEIEEHGGNM